MDGVAKLAQHSIAPVVLAALTLLALADELLAGSLRTD